LLRNELKEILDQLTYSEIAKSDAEKVNAIEDIQKKMPMYIYQG